MNVVLVGYGRMGRLIEERLHQRNHTVVYRVDASGQGDGPELNDAALDGADGVIEFALSEGIRTRIETYARSGLPTVVGTTGWDSEAEVYRGIVESAGGSLMRGSNFSVGAHLFFRITAAAAELMNEVDEYDVSLMEYHHNKKADYPSGTAITAAEGILERIDRKTRIISSLPDGPIDPSDLQISSVRVGSVPGVHEMRMDSPSDYLTVKHEARNRGGFALGAVRALEWLNGRSGWYEADAFIEDLLTGSRE